MSYFAIGGGGGGVRLGGGCQAGRVVSGSGPPPLPAYTQGEFWVVMLVGFSLSFVLEQRGLPGGVIISCACIQALYRNSFVVAGQCRPL